MTVSTLIAAIILLSAFSFILGRARSLKTAGGGIRGLHSLPSYYGAYAALWCGIPALGVILLWQCAEEAIIVHIVLSELPRSLLVMDDGTELSRNMIGLLLGNIRNIANGVALAPQDPVLAAAAEHYLALRRTSMTAEAAAALALGCGAAAFALRCIAPKFRARIRVEAAVKIFMMLCAVLAILTTISIILSLLWESLRFFNAVGVFEFLFGLQWSPQIAMRADQAGASGAFGIVPLFTGTLLIAVIAMLVAVPIGLMGAIYMAEYAPRKVRTIVKPLLEMLAGIPTVVYGFFAALTVAPFLRALGERIGLSVASESALAAGLVMGIMIIPFISSLSDDVITAVPQAMREGSYGLGATQSETIKRVILPAALPGIVGGVLLAVSRAIGETMIVVMAAGARANLTANPLESVTTFTVQIVALLTGDQEFDSPKTLAAFALGLTLFFSTLILNVIALHVVRKYREQYE